ncbi:MAG TPA: TonB-dependent receptor [Flavisolibacter sp.]|nr:TonB-dependent receptor [Flavisolibacter sp.]
MKKILALVVMCMTATIGFGQPPGGFPRGGQQGPQINGRFYGKIVDAANKGVEAASVTLVTNRMDSVTKKPKEVIVGGMLTSSSGEFSIENVPVFGRYKLKVTGIGYKAFEQAVAFEMPNRNAMGNDPAAMMSALDKDLGNIKVEIDNNMLGNVTVTASKPLMQMGIDRKVFNVDKNLVSAGGSAVDVMRNVPSLNVDIDGNVTLRNNAPQIFVDGRPTNLTLEQIPADAIESVEIITNPSAKFDASGGTAGILNIVLKKNKRIGYSGNIRANVDSRGRVGGGGDINIRQNKINFFASGMYNQRKSISTGTTDRRNLIFDPKNTFQDDRNVMTGAFGFGRFGIDYFVDNRNTITLSQTFARGNMNPFNRSYIYTDLGANGSTDSLQERFTDSENEFRNMGSQVSFKHNFPKAGREWTADVTYNRGRNENNNFITANYFGLPGRVFDATLRQEQLGSGENNNLIVQTDYVNPISDKSKFEMGARAAIRETNSATDYFNIENGGTKVAIPDQNVLFTSNDRVYAAYATYSSKLKNFGYQLGLRAESSNYEGDLVGKNQSFKVDFPISLFPSLFLSQKLNDNTDLQLNYSRRINRPGFWQLFPFTDISDIFNVSRGNPNLKPEFTNSLELSYSNIYGKNRDNLLASVYFKNTNNLITRVFGEPEYVPAYDSLMSVATYINANSSYVTGLELIGRNKVTKWWDLTANANLFTSKIDLVDQPDPDQFVSYFFKLNNSFKLPKNFSVQLSADYQSKIISAPGGSGGGNRGGGFGGGGGMFGGGGSAAQGFIRSNYGVDAAVRFEFLKERRASISLNVNDIFRTRVYDAFTVSPVFAQDVRRRRDPQVLRLNFNYRFGKFDASLFKRKATKGDNNVNMEGANF